MDTVLNFIVDAGSVLKDFNTISVIFRLLLTVLLTGLIGIERSRKGRTAGMRTHILVGLGACIASLIGLYINDVYATGDVSRIAAQVISGIGFLGAGTIMVRNHSTVKGLTTAAGIWAVGTIGIAIGYGFYVVGIMGAIIVHTITKKDSFIERIAHKNINEFIVYIEFLNSREINETISEIKKLGISINSIVLNHTKTNVEDGIGAEINMNLDNDVEDIDEVIKEINNLENVNFAVLIN